MTRLEVVVAAASCSWVHQVIEQLGEMVAVALAPGIGETAISASPPPTDPELKLAWSQLAEGHPTLGLDLVKTSDRAVRPQGHHRELLGRDGDGVGASQEVVGIGL